MRNGGLADTDLFSDVADAQLPLGERVHDADPRRITEDAERFSERLDDGGIGLD